jgi:outer membrane autotransporter protein
MQMQNDFALSSNGTLRLLSAGAQFDFMGDFVLGSESSLSNGLGRTDVAGSFTQSGNSTLYFSINAGTNGMLSADSASFESNATLRIDATQAAFSTGTTNVILIETSTGISGTSNLTVDADTVGRSEFDGLLLLGGNDLAASFTVQALKDYWNATGPMALLADELEAIGNDALINAIDAYDDPRQSGEAIEETYFTTFNNLQTALQGMHAAVGQSLSRGSEFREQLRLVPPGARGPERNNQLRGWAKYYGRFYTRDREGLNPEYDAILHGGSAGIDASIENLLLGISGGSSHYRIDRDRNARSDTVAYHGSLYGTYGFDRGYLDAGIFYGQNQVDTRTADPFRLDGSFDADVTGGYLGGGYDLIDLGGETVFTPEVSVQYAAYEQDAYKESGTTAVPRAFSAFDTHSILSSLGMNVSMLNIEKEDTFRYKADLRLHWMHEFNPDPDDLTFMLEGGSNLYPLAYPSLDEDLFRVGIGCSFFNTLPNQPKNVILRIDFDELFGDGFNSHNLSAKVIYAF